MPSIGKNSKANIVILPWRVEGDPGRFDAGPEHAGDQQGGAGVSSLHGGDETSQEVSDCE